MNIALTKSLKYFNTYFENTVEKVSCKVIIPWDEDCLGVEGEGKSLVGCLNLEFNFE